MNKKYKYRISTWGAAPEKVEIEKETEHFVYVKGQRSKDKKITSYQRYFDTLFDVKTWKIALALNEIEACESNLKEAREDYANLLKEMENWK